MRKIRYIDAIREAQAEEMRRNETVFIFGEGIGPRGGNFTQTKGMWDEFGEKRLIDTPISELGFTGVAVGAAMTGLRPIVDIMFWDFAYEALGQIANQAARICYLSNGQVKVPLVIRGVIGAGQSAGGHHSASPYPLYTQMPGLKVVLPSTPYDAKGLLKTAIRDDDPVLVFEHKGLYNTEGPVPEEEYTIPFGQAAVCREGKQVTLVATSRMVLLALEAAEQLAGEGISVEVIDPRTLVPLDKKTILDSIRKTNRLVVVDEAFSPCGVGGEIAALAADEAFYYLDAPIKRVHSLTVPTPSSPPLEKAVVPGLERVVTAVREVMSQ
jgi:pyruvate/2-oxoglutarate/acetoin dehydrogenase E1 component